jgi:biopolymer transport protein TolR
MNTSQLRSKMRRMRTEAEESAEEGGELNIVPYLDIVVNIVMFLMLSMSYNAILNNVNATLPSFGGGGGGDEGEKKIPLNLTVTVSDKGFTIAATGDVLKNEQGGTPTILKPETAKEYPYGTLTDAIAKIKDAYKDETKVIFIANDNIAYDVVVKVLDSIRRDKTGRLLFPDVVFSQGIAGVL